MQSVDTEVDAGALTGLDDFLFDLFAYFGYNLLDAGR